MIRRALLASAAVFSLALVAPFAVQAQSIFILGGASFADSDHLDLDTGWLGAGGVSFDIGENGVWAGVEFSYGQNSVPDQTDADNDVLIDSDVKVKNWAAMGFIGYSFPTEGTIDPYVFGGVGVMNQSLSGSATIVGEGTFDFGEIDSESALGYQFGAGISFGSESSSVRPFVEGRYEGAGGDVEVTVIAASVGVSIAVGS